MEKYSLYCIKKCLIGKDVSDKIIAKSNSAFDAAFDMQAFVDKCEKTCLHKAERIAFEAQRSKKDDR